MNNHCTFYKVTSLFFFKYRQIKTEVYQLTCSILFLPKPELQSHLQVNSGPLLLTLGVEGKPRQTQKEVGL